MALLRPEHIKEIAKYVAMGEIVFVHKNSRKIQPMPKPEESVEEWKEKCAVLEADNKNWLKIKTVPLDDELHLRKEFIEEATNQHVKKQLSNALNRKNPMRNFQHVIESDEILHQHWRNYKKVAYQNWVTNFVIDQYNY